RNLQTDTCNLIKLSVRVFAVVLFVMRYERLELFLFFYKIWYSVLKMEKDFLIFDFGE
ncbi:MAG: hypothetical protein ACI8RD_007131, partial [Bacillariaceae sp.]